MKKSLEEETVNHEGLIAEMRHKHTQELNGINEQIENLRKAKSVLEKAKATLEAENADLATELRTVNSSRQENDRRRKQAESQIAELQVINYVFSDWCIFFFVDEWFVSFVFYDMPVRPPVC